MPRRNVPPSIQNISSLQLPPIVAGHLSNGIPCYRIEMGTQAVVKIEIAFRSGATYEKKPLVARATHRLLKEGSRHFSAAEVAEKLDFYGCTLHLYSGSDTCSIVLYSLSKQLGKILPLLEDMLANPLFSQQELEGYQQRRIRQLEIDLNQNDELADRQINELIFGGTHPYGYNSSAKAYRNLSISHLAEHHRRLYHQNNCTLFISGQLQNGQMEQIDECISNALPAGKAPQASFPALPTPPGQAFLHLPNTLQTSIRIGRQLFNRKHPDYQGMFVLNTILGGYFGSRLMANLREDKGYTYNIYSAIDAMEHSGCFSIGTETSPQHAEATKQQVRKEMQELAERPIDTEELQMVRNYLLGNFLTMLDGPFNVSGLVRTMVLDGLPFTYFEELVNTVQSIAPIDIQTLAQQYFRPQDLWEVIVGP